MNKDLTTYYIRNAKFWGIGKSPEFIAALNKTIKIQNKILSVITAGQKDGSIEKVDRFKIYYKDPVLYKGEEVYELSLAHFNDTIRNIFGTEKHKSLFRSMTMYVVERIMSYQKRNRKKDGTCNIPKIRIHEAKSWYFKDAFVSVDPESSSLTFDTINGKVTVPYKASIKLDALLDDIENRGKKKFGGNYSIKQNCFIAALRVPFKAMYKPASILGFDFNKTPDQWIVFNNGATIPMSDEIYNLTQEIKEINKVLKEKSKPISERTMRSKQRRKLRHKWKKLHNKLRKLAREVANRIVTMAVNDNALLVLDSVKGGQDLGTFGQDHVMPALQTACENYGVPFYVVPCKNTSKRCSECGYIDAKNRTTVEDFKCVSCGHAEVSHFNASKNIAYIGSLLFEAKVPYGNYARLKVQTIIDKYGAKPA